MNNIEIANQIINSIKAIEGDNFETLIHNWRFKVTGNIIDLEYDKIIMLRLNDNNNINAIAGTIQIDLKLNKIEIPSQIDRYPRYKYLMAYRLM